MYLYFSAGAYFFRQVKLFRNRSKDGVGLISQEKRISFVTDGFQTIDEYRRILSLIKAANNEKLVVICSCQNFLEGLPVNKTTEERRNLLLDSGADELHFLPEYVDLLDEDSRSFSVSQVLAGNNIDELYLPVYGNMEMLNKLFLFMCSMPREYQKETVKISDRPRNALGHDPQLLEKYVPGSEEFLSRPQNVRSFRYYKSLRSTYSKVNPLPFEYEVDIISDVSVSREEDLKLYNAY